MRTAFIILDVGLDDGSIGVVRIAVLEMIDPCIGLGMRELMQMHFEVLGVDG